MLFACIISQTLIITLYQLAILEAPNLITDIYKKTATPKEIIKTATKTLVIVDCSLYLNLSTNL